ncbi:MAG: tRNA 2-thiouridine(34) synthase MnmA, partial [Firmicutes bacterium]|nr:tRNA 2-thiouridine(34) synthase MnmA [Bacillota bacterium]
KIEEPLKCEAKIRYAHKKAPCIVENIGDGRIKVTFDTPQRAVTPGQSVVLYDGDFILAGGIIL